MSLAAMDVRTLVASTSYLVAATLFLLGLQRMASPVTARSGIRWAGMGMVIATAATFLLPDLHNPQPPKPGSIAGRWHAMRLRWADRHPAIGRQVAG